MINGKIYKLTFLEDGTTYVGSTIRQYLSQRLSQHKQNPSSINGYNPIITEKIRDGCPYVFEILKEDIFFNKWDLLYWERILTELTPNTLNKRRCWRTTEEEEKQIKDTKRECDKNYRDKNNEKIKELKNRKFLCECGSYYTHSNKQRHLKTKKHLNHLSK